MKTKHSPISVLQFQEAAKVFSGGWGYWGHEVRTPETDEKIVKAANLLKIPFWLLCSYADSRHARHDTDEISYHTKPLPIISVAFFKRKLSLWKLVLEHNPQEYKEEHNRFVAQSIQYIMED